MSQPKQAPDRIITDDQAKALYQVIDELSQASGVKWSDVNPAFVILGSLPESPVQLHATPDAPTNGKGAPEAS